MIVAVTYDRGYIGGSFGHAKQIRFYTIEDDYVTGKEIVEVTQQGHDAIVELLLDKATDAVICDRIGPSATDLLQENGIDLWCGINGFADEVVVRFIKNGYELDETSMSGCSGCSGGCGGNCSGGCGSDCGCHG